MDVNGCILGSHVNLAMGRQAEMMDGSIYTPYMAQKEHGAKPSLKSITRREQSEVSKRGNVALPTRINWPVPVINAISYGMRT